MLVLRDLSHRSAAVQQHADRRYLYALLEELMVDSMLSADTHSLAQGLQRVDRTTTSLPDIRQLDRLRYALLADLDQVPGEWDMWDGERLDAARRTIQDYFLYIEEVRSPFNVGAIFRVAESFGVRKIYLSRYSASPTHNRALRSAMGTVEIMPWQIATIAEAVADAEQLIDRNPLPLFALETGGEILDRFAFPSIGMMMVGAEELGLSAAAIAAAHSSGGVVTISVAGAKVSLNVAVAFGIAMHVWYGQHSPI